MNYELRIRESPVFILVIFLFLIPNSLFLIPVNAQNPIDDRATLEQQLVQLESQIDQYENTIADYQKQGKSLKGEINKVDSQIAKVNLQIKAINLEIIKLDLEIGKNKKQIVITELNLNFNKKALASALRNLYEKDRTSLLQVLAQNENLSGFFGAVQNLIDVQDSLRTVIGRINNLHDQLLDQQEELALQKSDQRSLVSSRDQQKKSLEVVKDGKAILLTKTKGEEAQYQKLLTVTKQTAAQIRNRIFQFLGGGELSFGEAYKIAKMAQDAVGVRASVLLAVLDRESALGQNVGKCGYQEAMNPRRDIPIFLNLLAELNINANTVTVSCANRDGAYGGAMGPSQFIPSTWVLYKNRVAEVTGNRPSSPWRNADAFVATALYLKDNGASINSDMDIIRKVAAKYYAGSRWRRYLWTYGERVVVKAKEFEEDIAALN